VIYKGRKEISNSKKVQYTDIHKKQQYLIQNELLRRYKENKNRLSIALDVPNAKDYMSVVFYYAGDC